MKNALFKRQAFGKYLLFLTFTTSCWMCKKDVPPDNSLVMGDVYADTAVDQLPAPQGGQTGLITYLVKNVRYPAEAQRARIQGKVIVGFVVTDAGHIANVQVNQSVGGGCDEEAARVIKAMPDWTPGQLKGKLVNVKTSLPISFTLI